MTQQELIRRVKRAIERDLNIISWKPTDIQILTIYYRVKDLPLDTDKHEIYKIVHDVYGNDITVMVCDGLDTSKTSALLAEIQELLQGNN